MKKNLITLLFGFCTITYINAQQIKLSGTINAESNQIKNVADPTDAQDAVTKTYIESLLNNYQSQIDDLQSQIDSVKQTQQTEASSGIITDHGGNIYPYAKFGNQFWTLKNAEVESYRDGTPIPQVSDHTIWSNLTTGAWCFVDASDPSKGKLYNWYAVMGKHDEDIDTPNKQFAPEGWSVPSNLDWEELENYLIANGYNYDATTTGNKIAKSMASRTEWNVSTVDGAPGNDQNSNNSSGFNAFPDGIITNSQHLYLGETAIFSSNTPADSNNAYFRAISSSGNASSTGSGLKTDGWSVRFIKGNIENHPLANTSWKLAPQQGALSVGPSPTDATWWQNSFEDVTTRACLFDDLYIFNADGTYSQEMQDQTWLEHLPHGADSEGCGDLVAPWDGSNPATWNSDDSTITIIGDGAFLGLARVHNTAEDGNPVDDTRVYGYTLDGNTLTVTIQGFMSDVPEATWKFIFTKQ